MLTIEGYEQLIWISFITGDEEYKNNEKWQKLAKITFFGKG